MKRDSLFFQFFEELPSCFFSLIGKNESEAGRYELKAIEYKETAVRLDGVFMPRPGEDGPVYIWEAQYYPSDKVYANLMAKVGRFLDHGNPKQDWVGVVIYPNRNMEQKNLHPYRWLLASDQLVRIFLDELPAAGPDQFEMGILELIAAYPEASLEKARAMMPRVRMSKRPKLFQNLLIQFIETVILYQFPHWSREEIEKMLQVSDVRKTRVFQEAKLEGQEEGKVEGRKEGHEQGLKQGHEQGREEGREEGREVGREEVLETVVHNLLKMERPVAEIARITGLPTAQIRKISKKRQKR